MGSSINLARSDILLALMIDLTSCLEYFARRLCLFLPLNTLKTCFSVSPLKALPGQTCSWDVFLPFCQESQPLAKPRASITLVFSVRPLPTPGGKARDASRVAAVRQGDVQTKQRNIHIIHSGGHFLFKHTVFNVNVFRVCLEVSFDGLWVAFRGRGKW